MIYQESDFEESLKYNPSMCMSVDQPANRNEFFENLNQLEFSELVEKNTVKPKKQNIIIRILRRLRKLFYQVNK